MYTKKSSGKLWLIGIVSLVVVLFAALLFINRVESAEFRNLPNYTNIRGDFDTSTMNLENQPSQGDKDSVVTVVQFGDFKCGACKNWHDSVYPQLQAEYIDNNKISFKFVNYAFIDRDSILAASAGEAIYNQNPEAFWTYYDSLYKNQGKSTDIWATEKFLLKFVKDNVRGIDYSLFEKDLKEGTYLYDVKHDYKIGGSNGVSGTPSLFVNGQALEDSSYMSLKTAIENALSASNGIGDE